MIGLVRVTAALAVVGVLAGCAVEPVWAPDDAVQAAAYRPGGTPTLRLVTMINNRSGSGGHSALIIDGAQRVVFDPAGSWHHPVIPERNDVLYGMSPPYLDYYMDYHARETYHVVVQEVDISADTAARLIAAVEAAGPVPQAQCSLSVSRILSETPGFEVVRPAWFPTRTVELFAQLPGVRTQQIFDDNSDDNLELLQAQARQAQIRAVAQEQRRD